MTSTFGMIATLGYSFAAVFTLLAVVYYFLRHVRAVRDEMTGKLHSVKLQIFVLVGEDARGWELSHLGYFLMCTACRELLQVRGAAVSMCAMLRLLPM